VIVSPWKFGEPTTAFSEVGDKLLDQHTMHPLKRADRRRRAVSAARGGRRPR
jgi:hypothetical protein